MAGGGSLWGQSILVTRPGALLRAPPSWQGNLVRHNPDAPCGGSAQRGAEPDQVSIGVNGSALSLAIVLVIRSCDCDSRPSPILGHPIGVLAMDVQGPVTREGAVLGLRQMDREVAIPVGKGIGLVVEGRFEPELLVEDERPTHVCHLEYGLEASHQPFPRNQLQLTVSLGDEPP